MGYKQNKKIIKSFEDKKDFPQLLDALGLTYKPNIDDMRESPALKITKNIKSEGYKVLIADPNLQDFKDISLTRF